MLSKRIVLFLVALATCAMVFPAQALAGGAFAPVAVGDYASQSLTRFVSGDRAVGDQFGYAMAVSGDTAVVGARYADAGGTDSGAAYVFTLVNGEWVQKAKLVANDAAAGDRFGTSVAIDGTTILVGASYDDDKGLQSGSVYVFTGAGSSWSQVQKLTAGDGAVDDLFGSSVSVFGNTAAIGAYAASADTGAAYVFNRADGSWSQTVKLTDTAGALGDRFGRSIGVAGGTIMVGAPGLDPPATPTVTGKVCVFTLEGSSWTQGANLAASGLSVGDRFGGMLTLYTSQAVVGAWGDMTALGFYPVPAFYRFSGSGSSWSEISKVTGADQPMTSYFGDSRAYHGASILVGMKDADALAGAVYVYGPKEPLHTVQETPLTVAAPGVLVNDYDLNGLSMSLVATQATTPEHGTVVLAQNGGFVYTPAVGFTGTDTFTYKAWNGYGYSEVATVSIGVFGLATPSPVTWGPVKGGTLVRWARSPGATGYEVWSGVPPRHFESAAQSGASLGTPGESLFMPPTGRLLGTTAAPSTSFFVGQYLGPNANIYVVATGGGDVTSMPAQGVFRAVSPVKIGAVRFSGNSSRLTPATKRTLRSYASLMATQGFSGLDVNGYTASFDHGSRSFRKRLSVARAKNVRAYMATQFRSLNVSVSIKAAGYGGANPVASNRTSSGAAKNRRADLLLK
jgi:outer membrane protein OmpA-like peptidoglycan-associated protein